MMRAMPYNLQRKGVVEVSGLVSQIASSNLKRKKEEEEEEVIKKETCKISVVEGRTSSIDSEPTSTLDTRRSLSPPTSTSTLSSFNRGQGSAGGGGADNNPAGVAGLSEGTHKDDWGLELQNLPNGLDNVSGSSAPTGGGSGGGGGGIGMEEWDSMFPSGDGSLLPWIMGETDDPGLSLKHLLQSRNPVDFEGTAGLGIVDQSTGLEGISAEGATMAGVNSSLGFGGSGFNNNNNAKLGLVSANCSSGVVDCKVNCNPQGNFISSAPNNMSIPVFPPQQQQFDMGDEKPRILNPQLGMHQLALSMQNPSFLVPPLGYCQLDQHIFPPQAKRHNPGVVLDPSVVKMAKNPFLDQGHEFLLRQQQQQFQFQQMPVGFGPQLIPQHKPVPVPKQNHQHYQLQQHQHQQQLQEQAMKDQLFKAADLIQTGNFSLAQEILARLNHQHHLLQAKPLVRAVFYVKEALQLLLMMSNSVPAPPHKTLSPFDIVHKMDAYKLFSEVSPITQFVNFTSTQAILEALDDADAIHILDFDIGCGAQWASLVQGLPLRKRGAASLKITAFASLSTSHPFELSLVQDNLIQFATDMGVAFEFHVVNLDSFEPSSSTMPNFHVSDNELLAVNFPIWAASTRPSALPAILRFIKQRSPKIVISLDRGFDRCDLTFTQHLIHTVDSCSNFSESLDGMNLASDIVTKIEKFFVQPRIENTILGRLHAPDKMPPWKTLFASAGFSPLQFSNFTETQADYIVKRTPGRGFHAEKCQASLVLSWQRRELVAASAWRC